MVQRILIVDDELHLYANTKQHFEAKGFKVELTESHAIGNKWNDEHLMMLVVDIHCRSRNGWDLLKKIRQRTKIPIMIVTDKSGMQDKVLGFTLGADDYIIKPFEKEELWARMNAILRRTTSHYHRMELSSPIHIGDLEVNYQARETRVGINPMKCSPKEFNLLWFLVNHPNQAFSRQFLLKRIWGEDFNGSIRTVDSHIKNIRLKLKEFGYEDAQISTVWAVGYQFETRKKVE
jgi:two-component system response regulator ResD